MNLIAKQSGGNNLVGRPQARRAWYPSERSRPVQVEVWWRYADEVAAAARLLGTFRPGQQVIVPLNPLVDRNIILSTISISATGLRSVREIADAPEAMLEYQRESAAPAVAQVGAATHTVIRLAIDGYSTLAIKRKLRTADDAAMTTNLHEQLTEVTPGATLPRLIDLLRDDGGSGTRTVWVRVSHSSGGQFGAESAAQSFTFADSGGAGGDTGTEDPFPHREYPLS